MKKEKREERKEKKILKSNHCFPMARIFLVLLFSFFTFHFSFGKDFGFGFDDTDDSSPVSFSFSGNVGIEFPFYFKDYKFDWKEIAGADIDFNLTSKYIDVITSFNINYDSISEIWDKDAPWGKLNHTPLLIDELFLRAYMGPVNIEAGFRKLNWGRADSSGPLDVTNPVDFTDLRHITDLNERKIARPMLHITYNTGSFSKLEGVFIPNFYGHRFASEGRWAPSEISDYENSISSDIINRLLSAGIPPLYLLSLAPGIQSSVKDYFNDFNLFDSSKTNDLKYFQAGLRQTTTINSIDIGWQYYYGNLPRPSITVNGIDEFTALIVSSGGSSINPSLIRPQINYTRYHQFGIDYAQVLYGFNVRGELALNLTEDYNGSDPSLQNPFIAWSLGFDRDLFWGINLNLQCNETIRLFNGKIGDNPVYDCEAGTNITNTRLTARLTKKFLRDNLETRTTAIWDIENKDCYLIPSVIYSFNDFIFDVTAGFFLGDKSGELGQYYGNNFIRLGAAYYF